MAETYTGGCHCGRVRYEVESDFKPVVTCNCSICTKRGALWTFAKAAQFRLLKGDDVFSDYQFGKKRIHHLFCADCGIGSFARGQSPDGADTYAINVRCLDNVDVDKLQLTPFDGKSL